MKVGELIALTGEQEAVIQVLAHVLGLDRTAVYLLPNVDDETAAVVQSYIKKYQAGTPLAYLLGYCYFYNRKFLVDKRVLVPRFDTEVLVELAERHIIATMVCDVLSTPYRVLDLCCGSGVIGISLACLGEWLTKKKAKCSALEITLADISDDALNVAEANAALHQVPVNLVQSDLFSNLRGQFDLIVCNPPYVRTFDIGVDDVRTLREPRIALNGGLDGLYYYRRILARANKFLARNGTIMFEVGYDQAADVRDIALANGFTQIKAYKDLANHDRVVTIRR